MDTHACTLDCKPAFSKLAPSSNWLVRKASHLKHRLFDLNIEDSQCRAFFDNRPSLIRAEIRRCEKSRPFLVMHPFGLLSYLWYCSFLVVWTLKLWLLPLVYVARCTDLEAYEHLMVVYFVLSLMQVLVVASKFFRGFVEGKEVVVLSPRREIIKHSLKGFFVIDVAAVLLYPMFDYLSKIRAISEDKRDVLIIELAEFFLHFIRIKRVIKILKFILEKWNVRRQYNVLINHFLIMSTLLNAFASFAYFIPKQYYENETLENNNWLYEIAKDKQFLTAYRKCTVLSICYFLGISHDYHQNKMNFLLELILCATTIVGRLYTLFLLADLLEIFGWIPQRESYYESILNNLERFAASRNLPDKVKKRLIAFYEYNVRNCKYDEKLLRRTLSEKLKSEIFLIGVKAFIKNVPIFKNMPYSLLSNMLLELKSTVFLAGDVVLKPGEKITNFNFISTGTIAMFDKKGNELTHYTDCDDFGYATLGSDTEIQKFYYVAIESTEVYYINIKQFSAIFKNYPQIMIYFENKATKMQTDLLKRTNCCTSRILNQLNADLILEKRRMKPIVTMIRMKK